MRIYRGYPNRLTAGPIRGFSGSHMQAQVGAFRFRQIGPSREYCQVRERPHPIITGCGCARWPFNHPSKIWRVKRQGLHTISPPSTVLQMSEGLRSKDRRLFTAVSASRLSKAKREELTLVSREVGDALAVIEPHVPRTVGARICRASVTSRGSGASTAMSEAPALASSKYSWLINPSSVSARLTVAAARCSGVRCSMIAARIWPTRAPSSSRNDLLPSDEIETGHSESAPARTWRQSP